MRDMEKLILVSLLFAPLASFAFTATEEVPCTYAFAGQVTEGLETLANQIKETSRARLTQLQCAEVQLNENPKFILEQNLLADLAGNNEVDSIFRDHGGVFSNSRQFYKRTKKIEDRIKEFSKIAMPGARDLVDHVEGQGHIHPERDEE